MSKPKKIALALVCGVSVSALSFAQEAPASEAPQEIEQGARKLNTVIVTATRREENLQDVPIAVTAVSPDYLEQQGVNDVTDLASVAPSFSSDVGQSPSTSSVFRVRGIGTTGNNFGFESAVGVFLDGVYLSRPGVALGELVDIEQVEILRGPQGTLFGRNTSAGAINLKTSAPEMNEFGGFANATAGNFELMQLQGGLNLPIAENRLAARVAGSYRNHEGTVKSTTGAESDAVDQFILRGKLLWTPLDELSVLLSADYSEADNDCCAPVLLAETPLVAAGAYAAVGLPATGGGDQTVFGLDALDERVGTFDRPSAVSENSGFSAQVDWDLGFADLVYIGAVRDFSSDEFVDPDFVGIRAIEAETDATVENVTHEVRLQGLAFDDRLDWLIGGYYSEEDITYNLQLTLGPDFGAAIGALFGGAFGPAPLELFSGGIGLNGATADNLFTQESESLSVFSHSTLSVTDALDLTLGLRFVDESKDGRFEQLSVTNDACGATLANAPGLSGTPLGPLLPNAIALNCFAFVAPVNLPGSGVPGGLPTPVTFDDTFEDDELVWTLKAGYEFTNDVLGYASYTHGYKSGGFNLDATAAIFGATPTFESELIDAYEVGLKTSLLAGRINANIAAFHQILEDFQVLEFNGIQFTTFNVAEALSSGFELEAIAQLNDNLTGNFGYTYTDARYPDDCDRGVVNPAVSNLCGEQLTNAPENVVIAGMTYENTVPGLDLIYTLNGQLNYTSDRRTGTQATPLDSDVPLLFDVQDGSTKINLLAAIGAPSGKWIIEVWGRNVTDENTRGITFATTLRTGARSAYLQEPRTFGMTLRTKF